MSEVPQTNIFFFVTGIGVIVFTVFISVALYHAIKILKSVRRIVERIEEGSMTVAEDFEHLRSYIVERSILAPFISKALDAQRASAKRHVPRTIDVKKKKSVRKPPRTVLKIKDEG